ncbi:MAG: alkylmercury lyase [Brevinematales bacterium]
MVKIEFQYFEGCPNAQKTLENLMVLVKEGMISQEEIMVVVIHDEKEAEMKHFQGSPTILMDGKDIFTGKKPEGFQFSCRTYPIEGKKTGILPVDFIKKAFLQMKASG